MTNSEKLIEKSFDEYRTSGTAQLFIMYPKMRAAGMLRNIPAWIQVAKAPFDVAGYYMKYGRFIGVEIKENADRRTSLKIIPPDKKGTGLQYHQLEALVNVHLAGGLAGVVWDNGGEWLWIDGSRLKAAKARMDQSLRAEKLGYPNERGARSIVVGEFAPVKTNGVGIPLWLPLNPADKILAALDKRRNGGTLPPVDPPVGDQDEVEDNHPLDAEESEHEDDNRG